MTRIGVLIVPPIQLLDIAPIDLFAMCSKEYFKACNAPQPLIDIAIDDSDLEIIYIAHKGTDSIAATTPNLGLKITAGLRDKKVTPGNLDILLIPGPPPGMRPEEEVLQFVRDHVEKGVDLLTICSGVFVPAYAGVLDGKRVTGTRGVMDMLKKDFPKVKWEEKRYFRDGRIWSSGGITNGMDMVAAYLRYRFPGPLPETVLRMAEVVDRGQEYDTGKVAEATWWITHLLKVWVGGLFGRKKTA